LAYDGREGDNVVIKGDEVIEDDLYVSAGTFVLDGTVKGDLFVVGQSITVNGTVEGDLVAAGQAVTINGAVKDDVRIAGGALTLGSSAEIGDDIMAVGGSLEAREESNVEGSLSFAGYQALLAGSVSEDATMSGNGLEIRGRIGGDVKADVGSSEQAPGPNPMQFIPNMPSVPNVPAGLTIGAGAEIGGDIEYTAPEEATIPAGAAQGSVRHTQEIVEPDRPEATPARKGVRWFLRNLRRLVALVVVGLLLVWLAPSWIRRPAGELEARPWPSLGLGAATVFGFPVALFVLGAVIVLLAILLGILTLGNLAGWVVGLGIAIFVALVVLFGLLATYLAKIVVGYWGGRLVLKNINPDWAARPIWSVLLGVLIVAVLMAIPVVGGLFGFIITLFGLGTLWLLLRRKEVSEDETVDDETIVAKAEGA
jgi:cytoskeletal protein CcmA (bactofilin family)